MPLMLSDYECKSCGHIFEELADRDNPSSVKCTSCGEFNCRRLITGTNLDYRMGVDTTMPTMADKWARMHRQKTEQERKQKREHGES